jgi:hypothetical protein
MLTVVATWFVFGVVLPFTTVRTQSSWKGIAVMMLFVAAFAAGSLAVKLTTRRREPVAAPPIGAKVDLRLLLMIVIAIAGLGVALRFYDYINLRGFSLSLNSGQENRLADLQTLYSVGATDASVLSLVAAPLSAFAIFPALICFLMRAPKWWERAMSYVLFAFPAFEAAFFRGGALGLFFSLIFLFCIFNYRQKGSPLKIRTKALLIGLSGFVVLAGGLMFVSRVTRIFGSHSAYLSASSAGEVVVPSGFTLWLSDVPGLGSFATMVYWLSSYVGQGFHELIYLINNYNAGYHTAGNIQGSLILKVFGVLFGTPYDPLAWLANPRAGKYQTIFGDIFIDFGVAFGVIQCLTMGWLFALVHKSRANGHRLGQFLDPVLKTFVIMGIAVSSFSGALVYYLFAAILVVVLSYTLAARRIPEQAPLSNLGRALKGRAS